MNRSAVIQAAYFAVLALEETPSYRRVCAMIVRIAGRGIRAQEVRAWLAAKSPRDAVGTQERDAPVEHKTATTGRTPDAVGTPVMRAIQTVLLESIEPGDANASPPRRARAKPQPSARDLLAWAILDALKPHVEPLLSEPFASWRKRNKTAALAFADAGREPGEIVDAWKRLGGRRIVLSFLADDIAAENARARAPTPLRAAHAANGNGSSRHYDGERTPAEIMATLRASGRLVGFEVSPEDERECPT